MNSNFKISFSKNTPLVYQQKALDFCKAWEGGQTEFVIHTSGSTGTPKAIEITRQQMMASVVATAKYFNLKSNYKALCCLNVEYIAGKMMLVRGMEIGLNVIVTEPKSNPFEDLPSEEQFDFLAFVPLQFRNVLQNNLANLLKSKAIILGGAAVAEDLLIEIQKLDAPVYATYGMTETVSHIAIKKLNGKNLTQNFEVLEGVDINIDTRNCLKIKGIVTDNCWIQTNDVVELSSKSSFKLMGRADHIINSGGVKIQIEKVENAIRKILLSQNIEMACFVHYLDDDLLGQKLIAVFENTKKQFDKTKLLIAIREELPKFEFPKSHFFVDEFIYTPTMKIDKLKTIEVIGKSE